MSRDRRRLPRDLVTRVGIALSAVFVVVAAGADVIAPHDPFAFVAEPFEAPSGAHLFGTDDLGRDIFSGVVHGARTSLVVGLGVAIASLLIGVTIGATAGFFGGWVDDLLMRFTELVQVLPRFFLALTVVALWGPNLANLVAVLALTSWELTARVTRAGVLSVRERDYVRAATALGVSRLAALRRHVVPNAAAPAIALATLQVGSAILVEAGLSFLGLGDPDAISWGYLLDNAQAFVRRAWWMAVFPGVAIALAVLGVNLLGDGFVERTDGRSATQFTGGRR